MKLDEYRRVSQVNGREGEGFQSPKLQRQGIASYARLHGHTVTPNPEELDVSDGKLGRPILDKIIERIRPRSTETAVHNADAPSPADRYSATSSRAGSESVPKTKPSRA